MRAVLRAWIFDLDDTLYPEREYVRSGYRAVGAWAEARLGLSRVLVEAQLNALFDADFRGDAFQWWLSEQGLPESLLSEMVEVYRGHEPKICFYPETEQVLDELKPVFSLGLVTEGRRSGQEAKIRALGLDRWLNARVILGEEERPQWKPNREPFDRILGLLLISGAGRAAYVGDNPLKDFRGAREAGLHTVRVRREGGMHAAVEPPSAADAPDHEIRGLTELLRLDFA
jgi:putative hydrolase of the HAD superfamily